MHELCSGCPFGGGCTSEGCRKSHERYSPEGTIQFHATHTPTYDKFRTITVMAHSTNPGGGGSWSVEREMTTDEAHAFVTEIMAAVAIVEGDA